MLVFRAYSSILFWIPHEVRFGPRMRGLGLPWSEALTVQMAPSSMRPLMLIDGLLPFALRPCPTSFEGQLQVVCCRVGPWWTVNHETCPSLHQMVTHQIENQQVLIRRFRTWLAVHIYSIPIEQPDFGTTSANVATCERSSSGSPLVIL